MLLNVAVKEFEKYHNFIKFSTVDNHLTENLMKKIMSLIELIGIPHLTHQTDFTQSKTIDSPSGMEDSSLTVVNPCSGLPFVDSCSHIDVGGNPLGVCDKLGTESDLAPMDGLHQMSNSIDESDTADMDIGTSSILSVNTDSFDDATTTNFLDDDLSDTSTDHSFDDSWGDW
ncbi:MAG: hypothetical protein CL599_05865 [Alteromonas sp.]|nr:hypothetical protein [Alteromonas sp.]OUX89574.1 MAG: hypothetical protein CBB95_05825 [Alteromonas sp. TMED35]